MKKIPMNQNRRLLSSVQSLGLSALIILTFLGLQFLEESHVHHDGAEHSDCPLCLLSGTLQSPTVNHVQLEKPLQYSQNVSPISDSLIFVYFRGFLYTPCGPPHA